MTVKRSGLSSHGFWLVNFDAPVVTPVPIFRCKECKHWEHDAISAYGEHGDPNYKYCSKIRKITKNDFFCGWGKEREKEGQP